MIYLTFRRKDVAFRMSRDRLDQDIIPRPKEKSVNCMNNDLHEFCKPKGRLSDTCVGTLKVEKVVFRQEERLIAGLLGTAFSLHPFQKITLYFLTNALSNVVVFEKCQQISLLFSLAAFLAFSIA